MNSIIFDEKLDNILFHRTDSIKDSIWLNSGMDFYFNMPISSNCFVTGDFLTDTLVLCTCLKKQDTVFIEMTAPLACCVYNLYIQIIGEKFNSYFTAMYDVSPALVVMKPNEQILKLRKAQPGAGDTIEGYIYFDGKGKYVSNPRFENIVGYDDNAVFKEQVTGYFKCKINE